MIKEAFKHIRDQYVINQVQRIQLPEFDTGAIFRYRITFSGRVQKVGFRLEVQELARRLGLTGFCENLPSGDVLAELQGSENKIHFLITFMESLIRVNFGSRATLARGFSHTLTGKQPHRHGTEPQSEFSSIMISAHDTV